MPSWLALVCALLALLPTADALAADRSTEVLERVLGYPTSLDAGRGYAVETGLGGGVTRVTLSEIDALGQARGSEIEVHRGGDVRAILAVRSDAVLVGLQSMTSSALSLVVLPYDGETKKLGAPRRLQAPMNGGALSAAVACADPEGFTLLWQELAIQQGRPDARTTMARLGPDGRWLAKPKKVEVPWALAALAHNGRGYHLALYFTGSAPDQTRLSMVTLSPEGRPEQHPWWISAPQLVDEVQLGPTAGGVSAYFRGGDGTSLRSVAVTSVGQWGQEPAAPRIHGVIAPEEGFGLRRDGRGEVKLVR